MDREFGRPIPIVSQGLPSQRNPNTKALDKTQIVKGFREVGITIVRDAGCPKVVDGHRRVVGNVDGSKPHRSELLLDRSIVGFDDVRRGRARKIFARKPVHVKIAHRSRVDDVQIP